jgi:multidrug efflux pump subunit AcrA (membrane-fusion protein)
MAGIEAHGKKPTTVRVLMWEISASLADRLFALSNVVLILGAAAVLIGTIGAIVMSGVREQFANERISANETATAQATAESDAAKRDAAAATERAALAEQRAAEANLELARFKAPRAISPEQRNRIAEKMKEFIGAGRHPIWPSREYRSRPIRRGDDMVFGHAFKSCARSGGSARQSAEVRGNTNRKRPDLRQYKRRHNRNRT